MKKRGLIDAMQDDTRWFNSIVQYANQSHLIKTVNCNWFFDTSSVFAPKLKQSTFCYQPQNSMYVRSSDALTVLKQHTHAIKKAVHALSIREGFMAAASIYVSSTNHRVSSS
jgi:hypothetical protein